MRRSTGDGVSPAPRQIGDSYATRAEASATINFAAASVTILTRVEAFSATISWDYVMTDDDRAYQTRVYRYRCLSDFPEAAMDELRRTHDLSNLLIEIEKNHAERVADAWRQYPDLEALEAGVVAATETVNVVSDRVRKYKRDNRTKSPSPELRTELADARKARRAAKDKFREAKELAYPILKPQLVDLSEKRREELKATYKPAVAEGMYWANYNAVRERHEAAVKAVRSTRMMGKPADLRFRRWTGEGTLVVQLQRQRHHPPRTPERIADAEKGPWKNVGLITPAHDPEEWAKLTRAQQRRIRLGTLKFRIGAHDKEGWVELPVILHRPIPPEADICMLEITRRRLGTRYLVHVSVVVRLPTVPARVEGSSVALHIGWRALDDRSIRVGVLSGAQQPPEELSGVVRQHDGWVEIVIPAWWRDQMEYVQSVASIRGRNLDTLKKWMLEWIDLHPHHTIAGIETLDKWRSPNRFAALATRIRGDETVDVELRRQLEAWRVQDCHLWDLEANLRLKVLDRRNDAFAKVAAWALDAAALLTVDSFTLTSLMRKPDVVEPDTEANQKSRANRVLAAPGMLRAAMVDAASKRGVQVESIEGTPVTTHYACGGALEGEERKTKVMVRCPHCDTVVDQDVNALFQLRLSTT